MKSRSKSEIAMAGGMSVRTLNRWLHRHNDKMSSMGVLPTQRLLPPKAVEYICYELGIHEDDFFAEWTMDNGQWTNHLTEGEMLLIILL